MQPPSTVISSSIGRPRTFAPRWAGGFRKRRWFGRRRKRLWGRRCCNAQCSV